MQELGMITSELQKERFLKRQSTQDTKQQIETVRAAGSHCIELEPSSCVDSCSAQTQYFLNVELR
jgi:hypothetical protein